MPLYESRKYAENRIEVKPEWCDALVLIPIHACRSTSNATISSSAPTRTPRAGFMHIATLTVGKPVTIRSNAIHRARSPAPGRHLPRRIHRQELPRPARHRRETGMGPVGLRRIRPPRRRRGGGCSCY